MVYKWTMALLFSFEYCIDPKDDKSEEQYKTIAVEGAICPKLYTDAKDLLVQPCKTQEYHLNIKTLQLLFVIMPAHLLLYGIMCLDTNKLKIPRLPLGWHFVKLQTI